MNSENSYHNAFAPSWNQGKLLLLTTKNTCIRQIGEKQKHPHIVPRITDIVRKIPIIMGGLPYIQNKKTLCVYLYTCNWTLIQRCMLPNTNDGTAQYFIFIFWHLLCCTNIYNLVTIHINSYNTPTTISMFNIKKQIFLRYIFLNTVLMKKIELKCFCLKCKKKQEYKWIANLWYVIAYYYILYKTTSVDSE